MSTKRLSAGFTLIEIILVIAISGLLMLIAFAGQREFRDRTRFDAAVNEMMQQIEYTRNYAIAGVNPDGVGTQRDSLVSGAAFEIDNAHPAGKLTELEPVYQNFDASGNPVGYFDMPTNSGLCPHQADGECYEYYFTNSFKLKLTGGSNKAHIVYLKNGNGVTICGWKGNGWGTYDSECNPLTNPYLGTVMSLPVTDGFGHNATININPDTGLPTRS